MIALYMLGLSWLHPANIERFSLKVGYFLEEVYIIES